MKTASEYVSLGHPDKVADGIASYMLDEYLKHDSKVRFALEVQIKDHIVNLAGEVTSTWKPSQEEIVRLVKAAIAEIGYTAEYAAKWPEGVTLNADKVVVHNYIGQQSPDIAQGVDRDGWGDQGVFAGMATGEGEFDYMPRDVYFSHKIGNMLYQGAKCGTAPIGLDIKVLVTLGENRIAEQVVVAAPMKPEDTEEASAFIREVVMGVLDENSYLCNDLIINGTGAYVTHSSVGDAGVVGRKLAVDFYGLNCPIGGGAPWGKDASKADVTLNLMARYLSLKAVLANPQFMTVYTKISCCIGKNRCIIAQFDRDHKLINTEETILSPAALIEKFGINGNTADGFFTMCRNGLFTVVDKCCFEDLRK